MQSDHVEINKRKYKSILDCINKTYKENGIKTFYKGYIPSLARAVPVNAAIFSAVFSIKQKLETN